MQNKSLIIFEASGTGGYSRYLKEKFDYFNTQFDSEQLKNFQFDMRKYADLQNIHFASNSINIIITSDVFEHVRQYRKAFREVLRVLKPGGLFLLQIPYSHTREKTIKRVEVNGDEDIHLLPPVYHASQTLVYRDYGRDVLAELREDGFSVCHWWAELPELQVPKQSVIFAVKAPFLELNKFICLDLIKSVHHDAVLPLNNSVKTSLDFQSISIIVPVLNGASTLPQCLNSISKLEYPKDKLEVIVIDNGSTDSSITIAKQFDVKLFFETSIRSSYAARNKGIQEAKGELIAFTDADCIVTSGWLTNIVKETHDTSFGCFAGEIEAYQPQTIIEKFSDRYGILRQKNTLNSPYLPYPQTANAVYRKEVFDKVGLFHPKMTTGGDADIAWRMQKQLGLKVKFVPQAIAYHKHRANIREFYKQFRKYEKAKLYWKELYPDYQLAPVKQRQNELRHFIRQAIKTFPKNFVRYTSNEIDTVELATPFIKIVMAMGTLSARRKG
jgi:glycosyltransferase involved in cell wall biosynthesis